MYFFAELDANNKVISVIKSATYLNSPVLIEIPEMIDIINKNGVVYTYNKNTGVIIRSVDVELLKEAKWVEIKLQREQLEFGGFEYAGNIYDSDQVSQSRIMGAAVAGINQVWTLADNTTVELSASELQQLYAAMQSHIASVHERGRSARLAIESAVTKEEAEAIQL